jgi:DNA-directed RNA polymerase specialized sigma24 family protein
MGEDIVAVARATEDDDPRAALAATARLRRAADQLESVVVRRARVSGMSWAEIATCLGVSKQAVHQRYGRV